MRLAGGRTVVVDAKVTLAAYLEAVEAADEAAARARMAAHARHLRAHVDRLADKAYWSALPDSPEFVVLFVPGEAFLAPALEHDPALLEHAYARRVHLATPTTLVSLLRTVAHGWQQHALTENARAVVACGQELYARLGTFGTHVDKLGRSLGSAVTDFNRTVGSLERTVLPSARRMGELGLSGELPAAPRSVDDLPRPLDRTRAGAAADAAGRGRLRRLLVVAGRSVAEHDLTDAVDVQRHGGSAGRRAGPPARVAAAPPPRPTRRAPTCRPGPR